ncbi:hypothetical protein LDC_2338 [sediment metagenome]|uniref:Uncharacterized protein n=1 Tax=sediment metagenome TaxID=749907 RepID=D9PLB5_9ZZZZ
MQMQENEKLFFRQLKHPKAPLAISSENQKAVNRIESKSVKGIKHTDSLKSLNTGADENLFSARTVFPFVLFADTLKIDRQKLTIVHNELLWASRTNSIRLKDIRNVESDIGPLFGTITITSSNFLNNTQTIKYLRHKDIIKAQRLLQGFMIAHEAKIDTDDIEQGELLKLLYSLGQENRD